LRGAEQLTQKEGHGRRMEWGALWAEIEQIFSKSFKIFYLFLFVFLYFSFGANGATSYTEFTLKRTEMRCAGMKK
jgi:hypothetical protein